MTQLIDNLAQVSADYDVLYCDLWGCLHDGTAPYRAAVAALEAFRAKGGSVVLLTNSPRPSPAVIRQLDGLGVPRGAWDLVVSSGDAAQAAVLEGAAGHKIWHLGPERDQVFFTEAASGPSPDTVLTLVGLASAQGIVCTGLEDDRSETPEAYRGRLMLARENRLPMVCANPDIVVDYGETRIFCAGALAQLYQEIGGTVLYFGKPHPPIYDLAARRLAEFRGTEDNGRVLCIGDGIDTDIRGAMGEGLDSMFVSGGIAAPEFGDDPERPDVTRLGDWLGARQVQPNHVIGRLR